MTPLIYSSMDVNSMEAQIQPFSEKDKKVYSYASLQSVLQTLIVFLLPFFLSHGKELHAQTYLVYIYIEQQFQLCSGLCME